MNLGETTFDPWCPGYWISPVNPLPGASLVPLAKAAPGAQAWT